MKTEWHNYKSGRTGKIVGAYLYFPDHSDEVQAHVFAAYNHWHCHFYNDGIVGTFASGHRFTDFAEARLHATRQVAQNLGLIAQLPLPL